MLTLEQRPRTFAQLAGQDLVKKSLLHIIKDPKNAPKTLLLSGAFGSGKTTTARIFARALNCEHRLPNGDACGECEFCKSEIQDSIFYSEYDSAVVGSADSIRELRNTFYFGYDKGYKVIVLDEIHLISRTAMGALLKVFEEPEENVFFLLCTTDPEKLLPTIISRSFELRFDTIDKESMYNHLSKIVVSKGLEITPEISTNLDLICARSHGHMRNAIMLLDSMFLLKEDFKTTVQDSEPYFIQLLTYSLSYFPTITARGSQAAGILDNAINNTIKTLTSFPIANLKQDYENLVLKITRHVFYSEEDPKIKELVKDFKNSFDLVNVLNDKVIYELFKNDIQFQIGMIILSNKLKQLKRK